MTANILVISDSHGDTAALITILEWIRNADVNCSAAVFLGDGFDDLAAASVRTGFTLPWHAVRGNGDYNSSIPGAKVLEISSRKLFLAHGNRYNVREDGLTIASIARNAGAEAALFGHTHVPYCSVADGIFLLNPGSISRPRSYAGRTFAILQCPDSGPLNADFFELANKGGKTVRNVSRIPSP